MASSTGTSTSVHDVTNDLESSDTNVATAVAQVCSTPELLEGILSQLPVLDLVKATGVCKTFRNVISASPLLQEQLFMLPPKDKAEYWQPVEHERDASQPQAHRARSVVHFYRVASPDVIDNAACQAHLSHLQAVEPLTQTRQALKVVSICPMLKVPAEYHYCGPITTLSMNARLSRAVEPWTDMFLTSPPCQEAGMHLIWESCVDGKTDIVLMVHGKVRCEEGITLAFLMDELARRPCTVCIMTPNKNPLRRGQLRDVSNTTLHDQIIICKKENSKRVMRLGMWSEIFLHGAFAPTESEYKDMAAHDHVVIPGYGWYN